MNNTEQPEPASSNEDKMGVILSRLEKMDEIHTALVGNPLNPEAKPGLIHRVNRHDQILFGTDEEPGGLAAESKSIKKVVWMGNGGFVLLMAVYWVVEAVQNFLKKP